MNTKNAFKQGSFRFSLLAAWLLLGCQGWAAEKIAPALNLMPWPQSVTMAEGKFRLDERFTMAINGFVNERLQQYARRVMQRLVNRSGIFLDQPEVKLNPVAVPSAMTLTCRRQEKLALYMDESYVLNVTPSAIELQAEGDIGILRGLETFLQLLAVDEQGYYFPALAIKDRPRFPWRGLMLDVCRHFMPLDVVYRTLDGMAMVKMNVFHWHLSENQGFRIESRAFPRLQQMGSDGLYYTQEQVRDVIRYAAMRGIRVVPEFDIPGHSTAWLVAYPELASGPGPYLIERKYGIMDPTFNPASKKTYAFFKRFFAEMGQLFSDDYVHIGGDEVKGKEWDANPAIQAFKKKHRLEDNLALQNYFNIRIHDILKKNNKKMVGWDEIYAPGLDRQAIIHSWRGREALEKSARDGYCSILSNGFYIDLLQPTAYHYLNDPLPADSRLTAAEQKNILGGEATMWSELVSPETVDSRIWPRCAAIAERLWSPATVRDIDNMFSRLDIIARELEEVGLTHIKNRAMLLRRLAGSQDAHALRLLVDLLEPLKEYERHISGKPYTCFSPMSRPVDAAIVDPAPAREFEKLIAIFLKNRDADTFKTIIGIFAAWEENHEQLLTLVSSAPILGEIVPLSKDLAALGNIGKEAAVYIFNKGKAPDAWLADAIKSVIEAAKPKAELELRPAKAILLLLDAVVPVSRKEKEE
jgi:hexosaminidase